MVTVPRDSRPSRVPMARALWLRDALAQKGWTRGIEGVKMESAGIFCLKNPLGVISVMTHGV